MNDDDTVHRQQYFITKLLFINAQFFSLLNFNRGSLLSALPLWTW